MADMGNKDVFKARWMEERVAGTGFSPEVSAAMAAHFDWVEELLTEQREIEDGERQAQARRRLNTVGDDDDLARQRATKDESMEAQPAGQEGDLFERLRTTTVAQTRALQKLEALHTNTIILQKRGRETQFYAAVDQLTTELGNTVPNEIASISPQGTSVGVHVKLQTSRKRIFDKVHNWIATKNKTTIMTT